MALSSGDFPARRRVAVLVESSNEYGRGLLAGVAAYMKAHGNWSIQLSEMGRGGPVPEWLADWSGNGILARIENRETAQVVRASGLPAVDLSASRLAPELPWVEVDEHAVAKAALEHLRSRGFERLAYCGDARYPWSDLRGAAFEALARERGLDVLRTDLDEGAARQDSLTAWLQSAPRPLGVFACFDAMGREVLEAARSTGILVPQEVAVLGVDGDTLMCDLADPPLSTIELNGKGAGERAAQVLDRMMEGEDVSPEGIFVPPLGLTLRQSTDVMAVDDPEIARALHLIERHACDGLRVPDIVNQLPVSRRSLEMRFRARVGRSLQQEIQRVRVERIRSLLVGTELSIAQIAQKTGFRHVEYLAVAFKRLMGCSPTEYRSR